MVFSIGDLLVFRAKYYKDIGVIAEVQGDTVIVDWCSTGKQRLLTKAVKQWLSERKTYFYYPVVK